MHLWVKIQACRSFKENILSGKSEDENDKIKIQSFVKNDVNQTFSYLESQIPASPIKKEMSLSPVNKNRR